MKKSLIIFTICVYLFPISLYMALEVGALYENEFAIWTILGISILSVVIAFVTGIINIVMAVKERKQHTEKVFGTLMKFKLIQIPFYLFNFLFWAMFMGLTGNPFLFWTWILVPIGVVSAYSVLLSTSICESVYILQNKQRIKKPYLHIVLQFIFVLDVIDSIWLAIKSKKIGNV